MHYDAPRHNLELTLKVILEIVLRIKTMTLVFNSLSAKSVLAGEKLVTTYSIST